MTSIMEKTRLHLVRLLPEAVLGVLLLLPLALAFAEPPARAEARDGLVVPVDYYTLGNGLRVVLSTDRTTPIAIVAVYYHVGFRNEPKGRTGFAHLFEHLMFQGSANLGKMEFIRLVQSNGGILNGSTRFDFTNYFEVVPIHALETVLWAEADRMRGLAITPENLKNQQQVVANEVKVNVLNQPYGGFPWLDLPQKANENWHNAHNFYGELQDLEAATLGDAERFFDTFYAPSNAVLVVAGDLDAKRTKTWIQKYFGGIGKSPRPPLPDISEPPQQKQKHFVETYPRAPRPGLALGYHAPPRDSDEYYALGLIDQILAQGRDSRLYQRLVRRRGFTDDVSASINSLGSMFSIEGPTLYTLTLFHDAATEPDAIVGEIDAEIRRLREEPIETAALDLARIKMRSALYDAMEGFYGFGRADLLASFALFFDEPGRINRIDKRFAAVTPALVQQTARRYLRDSNRTILVARPGAPGTDGATSKPGGGRE